MTSKFEVLAYGYLITLFLAWVLYLYARGRGDFHNKFLDYRAVAEGLRVQIFWRLAGVKQEVADRYLRRQRSELDWIRQAFRAWTIPARIEPETPGIAKTTPENLGLVLKRWVDDQKKYFTRAARKNKLKAQWLGYFGYGFFLVGFILAVIKVFLPDHPVLLYMGLAMVVSALVHVYARVMGFAEHANQYDRMRQFYAAASVHLGKHLKDGQLDKAQKLILELGQEALMENADWLVHHRRQPIQVPA